MPTATTSSILLAAALCAAVLAFLLVRALASEGGRSKRRVALAALAAAVALPLLAYAVYAALEAAHPAGDAEEIAAAGEADGDFRARLVAHLAGKPRDGRAWVALARLDMNADRFDDAAQGFAKAIAASPKIARDAGVLCEYADALGMAQGGRLEGPPAEAIERALVLDPAHPKALEMGGSVAYERGDFRTAAQRWRSLLPHFPAGTAERAELAAAIERAERRAATSLPPGGAPAARRG